MSHSQNLNQRFYSIVETYKNAAADQRPVIEGEMGALAFQKGSATSLSAPTLAEHMLELYPHPALSKAYVTSLALGLKMRALVRP